MRIASLRIENYRNIRFAEAQSLPDFIVVGGINGCGKSAILEAIYMAKEAAGLEARNPAQGKNVISSDQNSAHVILDIQLDPKDRAFVSQHLDNDCPETARLDVTFFRGSGFPIVRCPRPVRWLLQSLAIGLPDAPGYFDYFDAHRRIQSQALTSINAVLSPDQWRSLLAAGDSKFNFGKQYLVALKLRELQRFQRLTSQGAPYSPGPFKEIQDFFDDFFAPMRFVDIDLDSNPFHFTVRTPTGEIDIDDLSSGERHIFNTYLHFHQLNPRGSIILFDEPDIHLHPDFARRYLGVLQEVGSSNQFWITTHSADMMLSVEIDKLYTVTKAPVEKRNSQFFRVVDDVSRYTLIAEIMGSTGLIGINEKVVFIEGEQASLDVAVYETFFPPSRYDVRFVPIVDQRYR
jgi:predicted ATPase